MFSSGDLFWHLKDKVIISLQGGWALLVEIADIEGEKQKRNCIHQKFRPK